MLLTILFYFERLFKMDNIKRLPRMRNINQAYQMLKNEDPDTIITKHQIKIIVYSGAIPLYTVGNRKYFDYDIFKAYISDPANYSHQNISSAIRKIMY